MIDQMIVRVSESTMRKYLGGNIGIMKQSKIANMAEFFNVNPSYLMGWVDYRTVKYTINDKQYEYRNKDRSESDKLFLGELIAEGLVVVEEIDE